MRECVLSSIVRSANSRRTSKRDGLEPSDRMRFWTKVYDGCLPVTPGKTWDIEAVFVAVPILPACRTISGAFPGWQEDSRNLFPPTPLQAVPFRHGCHWACCQSYCMRRRRYLPGFRRGRHAEGLYGHAYGFPSASARAIQHYGHPMGSTAEKVADLWKITRDDMENMAFWSHKKADEATKAGKFRKRSSRWRFKDDGTPFMVDTTSGIRGDISRETNGHNEARVQTRWSYNRRHVLTAYDWRSRCDSDGTLQGRQAGTFLSPQIWRRCHGRLRSDHHGYRSHLRSQEASGPQGHESQRYRSVGIQRGFRQSGFSLCQGFGYRPECAFRQRERLGRRVGAWPPIWRKWMPSCGHHEQHHEDDYPQAKYAVASLCGAFGNANAINVQQSVDAIISHLTALVNKGVSRGSFQTKSAPFFRCVYISSTRAISLWRHHFLLINC